MDTQVEPLPVQSGSLARWAVLPLILFATAISVFQHYGLSALAPQVSGSLTLSLRDMGIAFSALSFAMLAGYVVFGIVLNFTGTRYGYPVIVAGSSLATAATASAAGLTGLIIPRALLGLFAGGFTPAAIDLIAEWYPVRFHGLAVGLVQAAVGGAAAAAVPALGFAADHWSWRTAMVLVGALGVVWLPLWLGLVRSPGAGKRRHFAALACPQTWALVLGLFFLAPVSAFLFSWFPMYSRQYLGAARGWNAWANLAAVAGGSLVGGLASDLLAISGASLAKSRTIVASICAFLVASIGLLGLVHSPAAANTVAMVALAAFFACSTVLYAAVADAGPRRGVAFAAALGALAGLVTSLLTGPLAVLVINRFGFRPMFWILAVLPLPALACIIPLCSLMRTSEEPGPAVAAGRAGSAYAGFWRRFVAALIDGVLLNVVWGVLFWIPVLAGDLMEDAPALVVLLYIVLIVVSWLYFALMESSSRQATLGKMALGIVVTDLQGRRITFGPATGRYFGKLISSILAIGYIMAAFTARKQALHDMMAGTLVMREAGTVDGR